MKRAHAILLGLALAVAACWPDAEPPLSENARVRDLTVEASIAVICDAGLCEGDAERNMRLVRYEVPNGSDGHSWAPDEVQSDAGWVAIFGDASRACGKETPRVVLLASFDWPRTALCHELGHVARGCWPDDHEFFRRLQLDTRCARAMEGVAALQLSGATGGTD